LKHKIHNNLNSNITLIIAVVLWHVRQQTMDFSNRNSGQKNYNVGDPIAKPTLIFTIRI